MKKMTQKGFSAVEALIILLVVGVIGTVGWYVMSHSRKNSSKLNTTGITNPTPSQQKSTPGASSGPIWQQTADGWQLTSTPPACPSPLKLANSPVDISLVTSILYPGQTRGGNYKPHGGFRFDNQKDNNVKVSAVMSGFVVDGSRYYPEEGNNTTDVQYTFDIINNCGIMYRLGHLLKLDSKYQALADKFPTPKLGDSTTTNIMPAVAVTSGEAIATAVGTTKGGTNTFLDFGVYDLRSKNSISADPTWAANPAHNFPLTTHAICWFDLLPGSDPAAVKGLPAGDPNSGKTSDYCK